MYFVCVYTQREIHARARARAHTHTHTHTHTISHTHSVDALSHKEAEEQQDKYFASLDKTVDMACRVCVPEGQSERIRESVRARERA